MNMPSIRRAVLVGACLLAFGSPLAAQHRARMSRDLDEHLSRGSQNIDVIVRGTQAEVADLAARYNVTVRRYLRSGGAVLRLNAGQLEALQTDGGVDRLSSDADVRATTDVTRETIGADQVWAGAGTLRRALTGAGIGVAVIDSGIDLRHAAVAGRVIKTATSPAVTASTPTGTARTSRRSSRGRWVRRWTRPTIAASRRARISSTCGCSTAMAPARPAT